ncbi:PTS sugar transporter subunit IIA [Xylocopilactobacillus apis]|uniref:PTS fructose transporter subunit IIA n=1 Tax=Xylocopilactobacillus apis TaxID=2932183 RepID=A0AAU9DTF6_9LACO|nr:PTS sugar transporter subunit IIA [Xylocopilactobacillus apis]BDR57048.1 PTS fructose transporter subunit IIA [Xylocopilactobacillus apis]
MFFDKKIINLEVDVQSSTEIITKLANELESKNIVKDSYLEHVLAREEEFPTALDLGDGVGVAIPHTDSEYVNTSQIALATLKQPVSFKSMVNKDLDVKVILVFMIAMSKPHEQSQLLSNLMTFCQNKKAVKELLAVSNANDAYEILNKYDLN